MGLMVFGACAVFASVETVADPGSPTGYTTTFTCTDAEATDVRLVGSFMFYENNDPYVMADGFMLSASDSAANHLVAPEDWTKDRDLRHAQDEGYSAPMTKSGDVWTHKLQLPCASYMDFYSVSYDGGETWETVSDPDNLQPQNAWSMNPQYRSQFYVPFDEEKQNPADDWTWLMPLEDSSKRGEIVYVEYTGADGSARPAQVYLPAGYDANRAEPYKVLYMSHGTGGFEGDWFHQGNANNIADRLIADGEVEPFIIVAVENNSLIAEDKTPIYDLIYDDVANYLIPFIEENYNDVEDSSGRGFRGLSRGGYIASMFYMWNPELFDWYAPLSVASRKFFSEDEVDIEALKEKDLYLGVGFADFLLVRRTVNLPEETSTLSFAWLMDSIGVEYNDGASIVIAPGAHDRFTWPQLIRDYFANHLWK